MTLLVKKKKCLLQKKETLMSKLTIDQNNSLYYEYEEGKFNTYTLRNKLDVSKFKYSLDYKSDYNSIKKIFNILKKKKKFGYMMEVIKIVKKNKKMLSLMKRSREMYLKNKKINQTNYL